MKPKTLIIIIVIIAVISIAIFYFAKKKKTTDEDSSVVGTVANSDFPLKNGSRGAAVSRLQTHLNKRITETNAIISISTIPLLQVDGILGPKTLNELKYFYGVSECSQELFNEKNM
jgi:uncharacterized protein (UPF0333 family)